MRIENKDGYYDGETIGKIPHGKGKYVSYKGYTYEGNFVKGVWQGT